MHILIIPHNSSGSRKTCLSHRQVVALALVFLLVMPVSLGVLAYQIKYQLDRLNNPQLDSRYLAQLEKTLTTQRAEIASAKEAAENHLNALAMRMGKMQAQLMRINALGQRLTSMAGLDKGEFDFTEEPGVGGPESGQLLGGVQMPAIDGSLDSLSQQLDQRFQELELLEALLMDNQLQDALRPDGWPVNGGYVTSGFGVRRDPFNGRRAFHEGVDIANRHGAPIKALASGVVTTSEDRGVGYGMIVEINHGNGYTTRYAHTSANMVQVGDKVEKGQEIALVGSSGRSTGPHLHFEILHNGRAINPRKYLNASR